MFDHESFPKLSVTLVGLAVAGVLSCLIPDRDIVIIPTDPCGEKWTAHTSGAYGFNGLGELEYILDEDGHPIAKTYCFDPAQAQDMLDPMSDLFSDVYRHIIDVCQDRARELGYSDTYDTCTSKANVAYVEPCYEDHLDCNAGQTETGAETGADGETESPGFAELDLSAAIQFDGVEYTVSQHVIDVALADGAGLFADGTRATLVENEDRLPYGFEIEGVEPGNLGHALGLLDGDVITEVAGLPTAGYDDLFELANVLLSASAVDVVVARGAETITLRYRRASVD